MCVRVCACVCVCVCVRERERDREIERQRDRETERDRDREQRAESRDIEQRDEQQFSFERAISSQNQSALVISLSNSPHHLPHHLYMHLSHHNSSTSLIVISPRHHFRAGACPALRALREFRPRAPIGAEHSQGMRMDAGHQSLSHTPISPICHTPFLPYITGCLFLGRSLRAAHGHEGEASRQAVKVGGRGRRKAEELQRIYTHTDQPVFSPPH